MANKIIYIAILFCLMSCDVPGIIRIENTSGGDAIYITHQQESSTKVDSVRVEIEDQAKKEIILGFGQHWTDDGIRGYLSQINKIQILTKNDTTTMSDKQEMYQYFRKRRKGLFKQILKIKIE